LEEEEERKRWGVVSGGWESGDSAYMVQEIDGNQKNIYILYIYLKAMMGKPKRSLLKKDVEAGLMEFSRDCVWF
jgi:hypothetical protein